MPKTLLLADDSVTIQKVVGISFASEDVAIVTVDNGDDAIARAKESKPDLILADVVMPGKNGYEVCEAVKADPELAHIPVLLLTGTFEAFDEERAASAGAAGHVSKPFEAQTLVDQAKRLLADTPARSATAATASPTTEPIEPRLAPTSEAVSAAPAPVDAPTIESMPLDPDPGRSLDAPPPAPPIEDAFDFFDDEMPEAATPSASNAGDDLVDDLDIDSSGSAFAFGENDLSPIAPLADPVSAPARPAPPAGDRTVAILPDEPSAPAASDFDFDFEVETPISSAPSDPGDRPVSDARSVDESLVPVDAADLAHATILDPNGASGFDVSSSDLGDPLAFGPSPSPQADLESTGSPWAISAPTAPGDDRIEPADLSDLPDLSEPVDSVHAGHTGLTAEPILSIPEPDVEPIPRPFAVDPGPSEPTDPIDLAPPLAGQGELPPQIPEIGPEPELVALLLEAKPLADPGSSPIAASESALAAIAPPDSGTAPTSVDTLEEIAPKLRAQLHDTLEKIAWESFSDLTETIVRQAVDRVEKVAWEVIPQLAETLVREEIRRMKGDDS
jgi:CheY-like chemotaxis protein